MSKHITVGVDGSSGSARALAWAAAEAARHGFDLEIVHSLEVPATITDAFRLPELSDDTVTGVQKFSNDLVAESERYATGIASGITTLGRSELGSPSAVLLEAAENAYCVVVGSRGLGAVHHHLGSVSMKVAARAQCPVIVIPDQTPDAILDASPDGGVVVGVDDSPFSVAALRFALQEAALRNVPVNIVSAYTAPYLTEKDSREYAETVIEKVISAAQSAATRDVEIKRLVAEGQPAEAILAIAENSPLIVVGSHGRGLIRRIFLGSVSRRLLHEADRPIAIVNVED